MEDSNCMINMPNFVLDEKIGNKRVRADGEEDDEIHIGRLEKRPSGILGVSDGGDHTGDGHGESDSATGGGIIDTFISHVFQKNKSGTEDEVEVGGEYEVKTEDHLGSGGDGGDRGDGGGGGGIISGFFANMFQHNGSAYEDGDQVKSDHLVDEDVAKTGCVGVRPGGSDGDNSGESVDLNAERLEDNVVDLPSKDTKAGDTLKLKPDDYSERVFFLNNN